MTEKVFNFKLTTTETNTVLGALGKQPLEQVIGVWGSIQQQAAQQQAESPVPDPCPTTPSETKEVPVEPPAPA